MKKGKRGVIVKGLQSKGGREEPNERWLRQCGIRGRGARVKPMRAKARGFWGGGSQKGRNPGALLPQHERSKRKEIDSEGEGKKENKMKKLNRENGWSVGGGTNDHDNAWNVIMGGK